MPNDDDRTILLQLIGSLTLCDHMGDVSNYMVAALRRAGRYDLMERWDEDRGYDGMRGLRRALHEDGVTTLVGTNLWDEEDDAER